MLKIFAAVALLVAATTSQSFAVTATNLDQEPHTLLVTEGGAQSEIAVAAGETITFCQSGCFVTMPNGDREAFSGAEIFEIAGGKAKIK